MKPQHTLHIRMCIFYIVCVYVANIDSCSDCVLKKKKVAIRGEKGYTEIFIHRAFPSFHSIENINWHSFHN